MKILVCDKTESEAIEKMRAAGLDVDTRFDITPEELPGVLPAYDGAGRHQHPAGDLAGRPCRG